MHKSFLNPAGAAMFLPRRRRRILLLVLVTCVAYFFLYLPLSLRVLHYWKQDAYDRSIVQRPMPRVFIAAMIANSAPLLSNFWIPALLDLIGKLGRENVYVSILENESFDETRALLKDLQKTLAQRVVDNTFQFEEGCRDGYTMKTGGFLERVLGKVGTNDNWIHIKDGWQPRRISYLATLRNMVLEPLSKSPRKFDKVLFINDVIFEADDAIRLLQTNGGSYAAACAMDYKEPLMFYDTFAMRDLNGLPTIARVYPFFPFGETRNQLLAGRTQVEVKSCWNGMVSLDAAPFQNETSPLKFRAISSKLSLGQLYLEASEACLIHADMQTHFTDPVHQKSASKSVFVNTLVRVFYTAAAKHSQNSMQQLFMEGVFSHFVAWAYDIRDWWVRKRLLQDMSFRLMRVQGWEYGTEKKEPGAFCLTDQLQVLRPDGWAHI